MPRLEGEPLERDTQRRAECLMPWHVGRRTRIVREGTVIDGEIERYVITGGSDVIRTADGQVARVLCTVEITLRGIIDSFELRGEDTIYFTG